MNTLPQAAERALYELLANARGFKRDKGLPQPMTGHEKCVLAWELWQEGAELEEIGRVMERMGNA